MFLPSQIVVNEHSRVLYVVFAYLSNGFIRIMAEKFQIYLIVMALFYLFWPLFGWGQKRLNRRLQINARKLAKASDFDNLRVRKISTSKCLQVRIIHVSQTKGKNLPVVSQVCYWKKILLAKLGKSTKKLLQALNFWPVLIRMKNNIVSVFNV